MKRVILLTVTCFMWACLSKKQNDPPSSHRPIPRQFVVDIDSLVRQARPEERTEVVISYDPNVPGDKIYEGIRLNEPLKHIMQQYKLDTNAFDVVFICKDGYAPVRRATELLNAQDGYIVFRDKASATGHNWSPEMERTFAPYYLVWRTDSTTAMELPWPYGLINIKLIERDHVFVDDLSKETVVLNGYHLFRRHCLSCHAVNQTGGQVGPEMNWPRNITEYWTDENIRQYIKDPRSFRYNARMPAIKQIDNEGVDAIIKYLHYMKKH